MPGRNTMDALIQVIEECNRATDEGRTTHAVFDVEAGVIQESVL